MTVTKFPCPSCQAVLQLSQVPPNGARIRCPKCQNVFTARSTAPAPVGVGSAAGMRAVGRSSSNQMRAPAAPVGRSSQRMQAPTAGGSAGRMQAPNGRAARPAPAPVDTYDDYPDDEPRPTKKPKKKGKGANLGLILGLIGGAAALIIAVVLGLIFFMPSDGGDDRNVSFEELQERQRRLGRTFPNTPPPRPTRPSIGGEPTKPDNDSDNKDENKGTANNEPANPPAGNSAANAPVDPNANPFEGLTFGDLPAKAPRQFSTLKYLPSGSDMLLGADLVPLEGQPALARFIQKTLNQSSNAAGDSPVLKLFKELDGNPLQELGQGSKLSKNALGAGAAGAAKAMEYSTTVLRLKNPVDADHLVRALQAEAIPNLDGLRCFSLPPQDLMGTRFHFFLCFPDDDKNVVLFAQAQVGELDPLIRRGGDLSPTMAGLLDNVEPSHVWMAMSLEPMKAMLPMLGMLAGQAPPEVQALLKELPKAQGIVFQVRLRNNKANLALGLTFPSEGQSLSFSNTLGNVWKTLVQPQLGAMAGSAGKSGAELLQGVKIAPRRAAAMLTTQVSVTALKDDYPQMAAALANLGNLAGAMPGGAPAGGTPNPGMTTPDNDPTPSSMGTNTAKVKSDPNAPVGVTEGSRFPDASGADLDGKAFKLSQYKGKVIVLDFWGFWCNPCVSMIPHNKELVEKHKNKPFAFIGVNTDKTMDQVKRGQSQHKTTWRSFFDPQNKIVSQFKIRAFPTVMIIDGNGVIRKIIVGAGPQAAAQVEKLVEELIHELQ